MAAQTVKLDLPATLGEAVAGWPRMMRGAGGILAQTAVLTLVCRFVAAPGWSLGVLYVATAVSGLMAFGAVTRIGVAQDAAGAKVLGLGPFGFQMGRPELRLLGASLLVVLFLSIILSLLALTALALFGGAGLDAEAIRARDWAGAGAAWKLALLAGVGVIVLATPILLAVRLSLYAPATVGRGEMTSLTATGLANGNILPLLVGELACKAPSILWLVLAGTGVLWGAAAAIVGAVLLILIQAPLTAGFLGAAYHRLETEPAV